MKIFKKLAAVIFLVFCPLTILNAKPLDLNNHDLIEAFIDGYVKPTMQRKKSASGTVTIAHKGRVIFAKGYGFQDRKTRTPVIADKTLFRPGSASKIFTWIAVMQLVEKGKLDLDTNVNSYLKTFQLEDTWPSQPITLRHLLTHTAGFEDVGLGYLMVTNPNRVMPLSKSLKLFEPKRITPPGEVTAYSNYGTALAGLIVANVSGLDFKAYIQHNILDVLGMSRTSFEEPLPSHLKASMAVGYQAEATEYVAQPFEILANFAPAGSASATSTDMVKLGLAMLNGGQYQGKRILEKDTVQQMLSQQFSMDNRLPGMGLGIYSTLANGNLVYGHEGDTAQFHSELVIDPEHDLTYFVSFSGAGGGQVRTDFKQAFYKKFFPVKHELLSGPKNFSNRADKYSGSYKFWRSNVSRVGKVLGISSTINVKPGKDNTLIIASGSDAAHYVEIDKNLFKLPDSTGPSGFATLIAFQENQKQEIIGITLDSLPFMSAYKAKFYERGSFSGYLLLISMLLFVFSFLRYVYQRNLVKHCSVPEKTAHKSVALFSAFNLVVFISGLIVFTSQASKFMGIIPLVFKVWLIMPILSIIILIHQILKTIHVWKVKLLPGVFSRIRYSMVTLAGVIMLWFYWYWNLLGFQYL
ncbi:FmtA-like protein [Vibrio sp. MACH09]|uniref:serine hydrolase domain-containing protein n=1 Tax=Vibrio sp. MACH09 TaxID=3025122 RepID=UPI002794826D|nr:serine hydrolase domain-containing protein [Vibrio sp. MACH09]GLO60302.1 FmtA-like protein [Vibrio sp. MACH09]